MNQPGVIRKSIVSLLLLGWSMGLMAQSAVQIKVDAAKEKGPMTPSGPGSDTTSPTTLI